MLKIQREVITLGKDDACDCSKCACEECGAKAVGEITHFYSKIGVGIVELKDKLAVGDKIKIKGHSTEFEQNVDTIEIDHKEVPEAKKGDVVGIKVNDKVREGDQIYIAE